MTAQAHQTLSIILSLRSPVCLARRQSTPGQTTASLTYLTGTALRGALATCWLQGRVPTELSAAEQTLFKRLFQSGEVSYENSMPLIDSEHTVAEVAPQTLWKKKHDDGWIVKGGYGVRDLLPYFICEQPYTENQLSDVDLEPLDYSFIYPNKNRDYAEYSIPRRLIARTAINVDRGNAATGQLYAQEAIEVGQRFQAMIHGPSQLLDTLKQLIPEKSETALTMGRGRSRGLGLVTAHRATEREYTLLDTQTLCEQVAQFTQLVQAIQPDRSIDGQTLGSDVLLPITLTADMLLRDNYLLPSSDPNPHMTLHRYRPLPPELAGMQLVHSGVVQSTGWVGGWEALRGLPRPPQLAISMGSVWTFRVPENALSSAVEWWRVAAQEGLGERISEGFGRMRLCHPLHIQGGPL